jgi:hypothetical protein
MNHNRFCLGILKSFHPQIRPHGLVTCHLAFLSTMWFVAFKDTPESFKVSAVGIRVRNRTKKLILVLTTIGLLCMVLSFVSPWFGYAFPLGCSLLNLFTRSSASALQDEKLGATNLSDQKT